MKIRTDFVTNSSSSSFVTITLNKKDASSVSEEFELGNTPEVGNFTNSMILSSGKINKKFSDVSDGSDLMNALKWTISDNLDWWIREKCKEMYDLILSLGDMSQIDSVMISAEIFGEDGETRSRDYKYTFKDKNESAKAIAYSSAKLPKTGMCSLEEAKSLFKVSKNNELSGWTLSKYAGEEKELVIPSYIDGIPVVSLNKVCNSKSKITSLVIPDTVIEVGEEAFTNCPYLCNVTIPESVNIKIGAFKKCDRLKDMNSCIVINGVLHDCEIKDKIVISDGVKIIPDRCFSDDNVFKKVHQIKSVVFPDGLEYIGKRAFAFQQKLKEIKLPGSVKYIGAEAFAVCSSLNKLEFNPDCEIGDLAFVRCPKLADENGFVIINGVLYNYYGKDRDVVIPEGVKVIGDYAFQGTEIYSIAFPSSLVKIGYTNEWNSCVFVHCCNLADENGFVIVNGCFYDYVGDADEIIIPEGVTSIGKDAFKTFVVEKNDYKKDLTVVLPYTAIHYGEGSLMSSNLKKQFNGTVPFENYEYCWLGIVDGYMSGRVDFPDGSVYTVPEGVKYIGSYFAGYGDHVYSEIHVPEGVEKIARNGLERVLTKRTKKLYLPDSLEFIGGVLSREISTGLTVFAHKGTYAEKYAEEYGLSFKAIK